MNPECRDGGEVKPHVGTFRESAISYLPEDSANRPWSHVGFTQNVIHKEEFRAPLSLNHRPLLIRICYFLFKHVREVAVLLWLTSLPETRLQSRLLRGVFITDGCSFRQMLSL